MNTVSKLLAQASASKSADRRRRRTRLLIPTSLLPIAILAITLLIGSAAYALLGGIINSQSSSDIELQRGLIGWWKMDGNAKDATPYANNGTVGGATLSTDPKGATSSAYAMNGINQNITVPYSANLYPSAGVTVGLWVKPTNIASTIDQKVVSNTENGGYAILINGSSNVSGCVAFNLCLAVFASGSYRIVQTTSSSVLTNGTRAHIAASYDGTTLRLYVNGVQVATTAVSATMSHSSNNPLCIGSEAQAGSCSTSNEWYGGSVDDVRVYNRAISANEAAALYKQYNPAVRLGTGSYGLVAQWKMDGNTKDATPFGANGTISNATLTTDRKNGANKAYIFSTTKTGITAAPTGLPTTSSAITVSFWAKPTATGTGAVFIATPDDTANRINVHLPWTDSLIYWDLGNTASGGRMTTSFNSAWYNQWGLYTFTAQSGVGMKIYRNGTLLDSSATSSSFTKTGKTLNFGINTADASMDDFRIYNRALSATEITAIYNSYDSQLNAGVTAQAVNLSSGLVGYWPLSGSARDMTPYTNTGTLNNVTATTDRTGAANGAYAFNGTTSSILMNNASILNLSGPMTVSAWIKATSVTGFTGLQAPIVQKRTANVTAPYVFSLAEGGAFRLDWYSSVNGWQAVTSSALISTGTWYHVVAARSTTGTKLYLNGALVTTSGTGTATALANTQQLNFGGGTTGSCATYSCFPGSIDDVRIYSRTLSGAEVTALYNEYR